MKRKVSFVAVDYNGLGQTVDMVRSIHDNVKSCDYEIIVVDNASREDDAARLKEMFPDLKTVRSERNLGFAGGNNLALPEVTGDFVFFINNDTEILEDHLDELCATFDEYPKAGMVCPKICFFSNRDIIQYAGYTPMHGIRMRNGMIGYGQKDDGSFDRPGVTAFPHGAAMMVRREALEDVGPMPEIYFLYYEELDWAKSFQRHGWDIMYNPVFRIYHKDSMTTGRHGPLFTYYMTRSRMIFAQRNLSGRQRTLSILFTRYIASSKTLVTALLQGRWKVAGAVIRANADFRKMKREGKI